QHQSERTAVAQTVDDAKLLKTRVTILREEPGPSMTDLPLPKDGGAVLLYRDQRYSSSSVAAAPLDRTLMREGAERTVVRRVHDDGSDRLVVAAPFHDRARDAL